MGLNLDFWSSRGLAETSEGLPEPLRAAAFGTLKYPLGLKYSVTEPQVLVFPGCNK